MTDTTVSQLFTGWESERYVRFARKLLALDIKPRVRVVGREPITTTRLDVEANVIDTIWDGYKRLIIIETSDKSTYFVGGSNATLPIASETVQFLNVPSNLVYSSETENEVVDQLLNKLISNNNVPLNVAETLKYNIRRGSYDSDTKSRIINTLHRVVNTDNLDLKKQVVEILGLIELPEVLTPLLELFKDDDPGIRTDVALRFRGLEPVIKGIGEDSVQGEKCIDALISALEDSCPEVRIYAAEALGYFYNQKAIDRLRVTMVSDAHEHARWAATIALGRTNNLNVAEYLINILEKETSVYVLQGAMLGLGRIGKQIIRLSPNLMDRLTSIIKFRLTEIPQTENEAYVLGQIKDYAAYVAGELGEKSIECFEPLIECLNPNENYRVKSNAVLSLSKLFEFYFGTASHIEKIKGYLHENLDLEKPIGWPNSAFYNWFLVGAAELASILEFHELSSIYYERAAKAFRSTPWLSQYYEGIGYYEAAESLCENKEVADSRRKLENAIRLFDLVRSSQEFRLQSDKALSGLEFKYTLATARLHMIKAAETWSLVVLNPSQYKEIKTNFTTAFEHYSRIDVLGVSDDSKKLSRAETNLIICLKGLAEVGAELVDLKLLSMNLDKASLELILGRVSASVKSLNGLSKKTRSKSLAETSGKLLSYLEEANNQKVSGSPITEAVEVFLDEAREIYSRSLPTPGTCPIIDFGSAKLSVKLKGSIAGDGSREEPFLFPSNTRVVFEFVVTVNKRTKNDQLIFRGIDAPAGSREILQEIPVHESSYSLRPVDYGELAPSLVATHFTFALEFRNQGCGQPAHILDTWIRVYDKEREFTTELEKMTEREKSLSAQIEMLEQRLESLKLSYSDPNSPPPISLMQQIRQLDVALSTKKEELAKLQSSWRI